MLARDDRESAGGILDSLSTQTENVRDVIVVDVGDAVADPTELDDARLGERRRWPIVRLAARHVGNASSRSSLADAVISSSSYGLARDPCRVRFGGSARLPRGPALTS